MSRRLLVLLSVLALAVGVLAPVVANAADTDDDYVIVTLTGAAIAYDDDAKTNGRVDPGSRGYSRALQRMEGQHGEFAERLGGVAPRAEIVRDYYITVNAVALKLNGSAMSEIAAIPDVERVVESVPYTLDMDQSVGLIGADDVWDDLDGQSNAGAGIRVGVIDSGIWTGHPFFSCDGKDVKDGGVFYSGQTGTPPSDDLTDEQLFSSPHGTHVAGTIGGCVTTIPGEDIWSGTELSGVAPGVELWDYNVFPAIGAGYSALGGSALTHDIIAAIEESVVDGMDVINMSLGGKVQGPYDVLAEASNAAVAAGVVVVVSAGNEGDGSYTIGSPGSASDVITVGATTNTRGLGVRIIDADGAFEYLAVPGEFPDFSAEDPYTIVDWSGADNEACSSALEEGTHTEEVVVIARGTCTFSQKVANAKAAGADGVIVYTYEGQDPIGMAMSEGFDDDIPAVMVSYLDGTALEGGATATITPPMIVDTDENLIADFSSRGPVPYTDIVKPDVVATGVNVLSSVYPDGWELFNGTSMAAPHVTGAAALLLDGNPGWEPFQVKSALATTGADLDYSVWTQGGGLIDLPSAMAAETFFSPTNASFGVWKGKASKSETIEIALSGDTGCTVDDIEYDGGGTISAEIAGETLSVTFTGGNDIGSGMYNGTIPVTCGGVSYAIPWGIVANL